MGLNVSRQKTVRTTIMLLGLFLCPTFALQSRPKADYRGFSGGMYLHTGYLQGNPFSYENHQGSTIQTSLKGTTFGIGGRGACQIGNYYRCGIEGYATTMTYDKAGSYQRIGWGGVLNEAMIEAGRFTSFLGMTIGGGSADHLIMQQIGQKPLETIPANYHSYSLFILNPYIGTQYKLNDRLSLSLKADYMFSPNGSHNTEFATGFRIYVGILFIKLKQRK